MSIQNNSKPGPAPVVVVKDQQVVGISMFMVMPAVLASILFNGGLIAVLYFVFQGFTGVATAMEANLPVIWVVMDNMAFGTIAGLETQSYGWDFGCTFQCDGKPYRVDFAAMARGCGADGVMIGNAGELGPALRTAIASNRPALIQVPMENAPTPTPGHWNILDIYRQGR